jgi:hypothetical protein
MYDSLGEFMNVNQIALLFCWVVGLLCIDELRCRANAMKKTSEVDY